MSMGADCEGSYRRAANTMMITTEKLELLYDEMIEAAKRVDAELKAWQVVMGSRKSFKESLIRQGATNTKAQTEFQKLMKGHEKAFDEASQDFHKKRKEFNDAHRKFRAQIAQ